MYGFSRRELREEGVAQLDKRSTDISAEAVDVRDFADASVGANA